MNTDERIKVIMKKIEKLSQKHPKFRCGEFRPQWNEPLKGTEADFCEIVNGYSGFSLDVS